MPVTDLSLTLSIDEKITNEFLVPKQNGITKGKVEAWRTFLTNGSNNGFGDFFNVIPQDTEPGGVHKYLKSRVRICSCCG